MVMNKLMLGKRGIVTGIANDRSIAWEIAKTLQENGAELCLTYQGEVLHKRIMPLAEEIGCDMVYECDVTQEDSVKALFQNVENKWQKIDFIVHAIAFANRAALNGRYLDTNREHFLESMDVSCYSLLTLLQNAEKLMNPGFSAITLSYFGAQKVIPKYNVMGVAKAALESSVKYLAVDLGRQGARVNAISAGPIRTLAASAIGDFREMLDVHSATSPLKRNTSQKDVANSTLYLLSDLASGVTGEVHYVDCGYNIMGMSIKAE
ncbi:MAG: enoyl-ACP reductase [Rickettsiaceae bacterium]|nr:enoyl-ACP reductase [Rickettsiaceae bacterium]